MNKGKVPGVAYLCGMARRWRKQPEMISNVTITDTADEGLAIGRCEDGRVILVKGAVPGDIADVIGFDKKKGMLITRPTAFSTLSPDRVEPFCPHFGTCGGCKWQHMSYAAQLRFKEKKVRDAFERLTGIAGDKVQPIVGAPAERYYRNKLEYTASDRRWLTDEEMQQPAGSVQTEGIGFHLPGAFDKVLDIEHCYLQDEPSNAIRLFIKSFCRNRNWPFFNLRSKSGFMRNIIVRNTQAGDVMVVLVVGQDERDRIQELVHGLTSTFPSIVSVYSVLNTKQNDSIHDLEPVLEYGHDTLIETLGHVRFHIGPKSFFQTNSVQATTLYSLAKKLADLEPEDHLYDLYCGVGSLGIFMADSCRQVVGIEQIAEAIDDAKRNAALNGLNHTRFFTGQVEMLLDPDFVTQYGKPDVVITDPPRAGMHPDVVKTLAKVGAPRMVYVSCNPATMARDIKGLADVYEVVTAIPVDMFPQTHHIECVALLHKK